MQGSQINLDSLSLFSSSFFGSEGSVISKNKVLEMEAASQALSNPLKLLDPDRILSETLNFLPAGTLPGKLVHFFPHSQSTADVRVLWYSWDLWRTSDHLSPSSHLEAVRSSVLTLSQVLQLSDSLNSSFHFICVFRCTFFLFVSEE